MQQEPVLVVDDDRSVRELVCRLLSDEGLPALAAEDAETALAVIATRAVSLVVLDERLPGMSGRDLLLTLRADPLTAALPIVMLTGLDSVADRVGGLEAGADDYISKPFEPEELVARVRSHLRGRQTWLAVLEAETAQRVAIAHALARISPQAPVEWASQLLCRELTMLAGVTHVAVLAFLPSGDVTLLAHAGQPYDGPVVGRPLSLRSARQLRALAAAGPAVVESGDNPLQGLVPHAIGPDRGDVAIAPLRRSGVVVGLLAVRAVGGTDEATGGTGRALSVAIEFGAHAVDALGSAFEELASVAAATDYLEPLLARRTFTAAFQRVVDLETLATVGYEALSRFPEGRSPIEVFADARRVDRGAELELAAVEIALDAATALPGTGWLSLNLSPSTVVETPDLARRLARADREVVIEITEQERIDDYPRLLDAVAAAGAHVRLAIDDAGAGYSSFSHVLALSPAFIKLDRGWVAGIDEDPTRRALVAGVAHFSRETGTILLAEGIEDDKELMTLRQLGVELGQGYLLGHPQVLGVA